VGRCNDDVTLAKLLLSKGANVNAANTFGGTVKIGPIALVHLTPLMWAAPHSSPRMVKTLLDAGAKVNETDVRGMTPLMLAVGSDNQDVEVVKLLIASQADVNKKSARVKRLSIGP
jgi:ankyrin repeat protein